MNDGAEQPPALTSAMGAAELATEVQRLTDALEKEQEKLARWKAKAQSGVDVLRQRIVDLTSELETANATCDSLRASLATSGAASSAPDRPFVHCLSSERLAQFCFAIGTIADDVTHEKVEALLDAVDSRRTAGSVASRSDFDVYKRRMETTLRLQSKNNEALQQQVQELQSSLASANALVRDRDRTLEAGNATVTTLEQRLKEALEARAEMEAQQQKTRNLPNMEDVNQLEDRYESALQRQREECAARENAIFAQHTQELQRLAEQHDSEVQQLNDQWQRRLKVALDEAARQQKAAITTASTAKTSAVESMDNAYKALLREHETLKTEFQTLQAENRGLKTATRGSLVSTSTAAAAGGQAGENTVPLPTTLADAHTALSSQKATIERLSQELWTLKREVLDMRRRASEQKPAAEESTPLTVQQFEYLRSVVVNVLCFHKDDRLVMNLLPVLSTLLHMTPEDLRHICTANPAWAVK